MKQKGFTLIEIIVVAAIIGVLATVVLFVISKPQNEASDSAVRNNLVSIIKQGNIYYLTNNSYGTDDGSCTGGVFSDPVVVQAFGEVYKNLGGAKSKVCSISSNGNNMAILVDGLRNGNSKLCVDSSNYVGTSDSVVDGLCVR